MDYYTSRAPLAEIYESLRMYGRESGPSRCVFFFGRIAHGRHFEDLQVRHMLRVLGHFSLMRGHPGREVLS